MYSSENVITPTMMTTGIEASMRLIMYRHMVNQRAAKAVGPAVSPAGKRDERQGASPAGLPDGLTRLPSVFYHNRVAGRNGSTRLGRLMAFRLSAYELCRTGSGSPGPP